jgi:NTP pyrophosphatase (non-canonical NTP hydrolase)
MNLNNLIEEAHEIAKEKGWHDKPVSFAEYIANIHAELSEAWEEWRDNQGLNEAYFECDKPEEQKYCIDLECQYCDFAKPGGIPIELADVVIWICDMCGALDIDLEKAIELKMAYNRTRSWKHGNKRV